MKRFVTAILVSISVAVLCVGQYPGRISPRRIVRLPDPNSAGEVSLEEALAKRRSVREFTPYAIDMARIGQLAWAGQGITERQRGFRTAPSAGALYPMVLYFATQDAVFVYNPAEHTLETAFEQDVRGGLAAAADQPFVALAPCDIIVAGSVRQLVGRYGKDAKKFMYLEAGHIAQNILLQAVCLDLAAVPVGSFDIRDVTRICRLPKDVEPVYIICVGRPVEGQASEKGQASRRRAALILPAADFRDEELFETKRVLDQADVQTVIASSRTGPVRGMLGNTVEVEVLIEQLKVDDFDAIVFIGGTGARQYVQNPIALNIVREAAAKGKVVAAICIAPSILASAGVLKGVRATSAATEREILQLGGAVFTGVPLERDGPFITASDPRAAGFFGHAIVDALAGKQ